METQLKELKKMFIANITIIKAFKKLGIAPDTIY